MTTPAAAPARRMDGNALLILVVAALAMTATLPGRTFGLGLVTKWLLLDLSLSQVEWAQVNLWATLIGSLFCFPAGRLLAVYDYPASQCALARVRPGTPPVAERFELYLGPLELANGYHELADAAEQGLRFERDRAVRRQRGDVEPPRDERLLAALASGFPHCAGVALGVDRLLMAMLGTGRIGDVLAFDFARA